jgi:hypothetical protein
MDAFNDWLGQQSRRGDRVGDLARDMRIDLTWPTAKVSRRRLHAYLESQGAIQGVFDALDEAWDEWDVLRKAER